jgi:hypothetical protein
MASNSNLHVLAAQPAAHQGENQGENQQGTAPSATKQRRPGFTVLQCCKRAANHQVAVHHSHPWQVLPYPNIPIIYQSRVLGRILPRAQSCHSQHTLVPPASRNLGRNVPQCQCGTHSMTTRHHLELILFIVILTYSSVPKPRWTSELIPHE